MKILQIEDDSATAQCIGLMLRSEGFNVYSTDLGAEGVDLGKLYDYDLILLDLNLPDMSGYNVLKELRAAKIDTPILILSGLAGIEDIVKGLNFGADDYMTKPFHKDELVARINAIVRRSNRYTTNILKCGPLTLDITNKTVHVSGKPVHLTGNEYSVFEILMLRKGKLVTKEAVMNHLYGGRDEPDIKITDVIVCHIRHKINIPNIIETVWSKGWCLNPPLPNTQSSPLPKASSHAKL